MDAVDLLRQINHQFEELNCAFDLIFGNFIIDDEGNILGSNNTTITF